MARRDFSRIYRRRQEQARAEGFTSYGQKRRVLHELPDLISEGNRLACGPENDPPAEPRAGSLMCHALNERVNPPGRARVGDWRWRLWVAVEHLRRQARAAS